MRQAVQSWRLLLRHWKARESVLDFANAGRRVAAKSATNARTTSSSTRVKAAGDLISGKRLILHFIGISKRNHAVESLPLGRGEVGKSGAAASYDDVSGCVLPG